MAGPLLPHLNPRGVVVLGVPEVRGDVLHPVAQLELPVAAVEEELV